MVNLLPMIGLVAHPLLYIGFFSINSSIFSGLGLSGDNMLLTVGFCSLLMWSWAAFYSRSVNRFFKKRDKGNFNVAFGVNSVAEAFMVFVYLFVDLTMGNTVSGALNGLVVFLLLMFLGGNALRVWLTAIAFEVERGEAINSQKYNLIIETVLWSPWIAYSIYMAYFMGGIGL